MLRLTIIALILVGGIQGRSTKNAIPKLEFTIEKTWTGSTVAPNDRINVTLEAVGDTKDLLVSFSAPFYNDPAPSLKPGETINYLWKYEIVEAYFLNDDDQYTQIQLGPNGHHLILFFNGSKKKVLCCLPIKASAKIEGSKWTGSVLIPGHFLPAKITRFNAAAMHGFGKQRQYLQLYPTGKTVEKANFHVLAPFQPIQMSALSPAFNDNQISHFWASILRGETPFKITKTWDGKNIPEDDQVDVILKKAENNKGIIVNVKAPFYNNPAPDAAPGERFVSLWRHETVELFFSNRDDQYIQIMVSPQGHYLAIIFNGKLNYINHELTLDVTSKILGASWTSEFLIPVDYFPPSATKFSAAAQHTLPSGKRQYLTLTPSPINREYPDFHDVTFYQSIDLRHLMDVREYTLSPIWNAALKGEFDHVIRYAWQRDILPQEDQVKLSMNRAPNSKDLVVKIDAPFYGDPAPVGRQGSLDLSLYKHEVVEVYFGNDNAEYLEIQLGPHGHYEVLLFNGKLNLIRHSLPLNVSTTIRDSTWHGEITIPFEYLPPQVSIFNAASMHGNGTDRQYNTLTLCTQDSAPDFHRLESFRVIRLEHLSPVYANIPMSSTWDLALKRELEFTIQTTWDERRIEPSEEVKVFLKRTDGTNDVLVRVEAPFYDDPPPQKGDRSLELHRHEVVEVYFANEDELYLQIQLSPHGSYFVLIFNGERNVINRGLPLTVDTSIQGSTWTAETWVPSDYFPPQVRQFNAAAMHGEGAERVFLSMNPDPQRSEPDFHNVPFRQYLDLRRSKLEADDDSAFSPLWTSSLKGEYHYTIDKTWNGGRVDEKGFYNLTLKGNKNSMDLILRFSAPYHDDPVPPREPGHMWGLWRYEDLEAFFVNDKDQYLQIIVGPHGHFIVLLHDGVKNKIIWSLPLNFTSTIEGSRWSGEIFIPADYFPPQVTKFNAYGIHGLPTKRKYLALYPTDGSTEKANFHDLRFFRPIDMFLFNPMLKKYTEYSAIWKAALNNV